jgi:hypothetical protein
VTTLPFRFGFTRTQKNDIDRPASAYSNPLDVSLTAVQYLCVADSMVRWTGRTGNILNERGQFVHVHRECPHPSPDSRNLARKQAQEPKDIKPSKQIVAKNDTPGKENLGFGNVQ